MKKLEESFKQKRIYNEHQAFSTVYKKIKNSSKTRVDGFDAPKQYHHSPSKLKVFRDFSHYIRWATELYSSASDLISELKVIYDKSTSATSSYYILASERGVENILEELNNLQVDIQYLREDIHEFQVCMLATHISEKQAEIEPLSDHLRQLSFMEDRIIETCNRKLFEISSRRMSFYSLLVSSIAIVISFTVIFTART